MAKPIRIHLIKGQKFGWLMVLHEAERRKLPSGKTERIIACECECGKVIEVFLNNLRSGHTISCGCHTEKLGLNFFKHGLTKHPLYSVWRGVLTRTIDNPNYEFYKNYYGRGIRVCDEWRKDFVSFYNWAISNGYKKGLELDRENNDGNYEPSNCRFVTPIVNCNNRSDNIFFDFNGCKITISQLARITGLHWGTLYNRIMKLGMSMEEAVQNKNYASNKRKGRRLSKEQVLEIFNSSKKRKDMSVMYGVSVSIIASIKTGRNWSHITGKQHEQK